MANRTATLFIRNKARYHRTPKKLTDLPEGETFVLFWYQGKAKKAKAVGRFADEAQTALINKEAELRRAAITGTSAICTRESWCEATWDDYICRFQLRSAKNFE
jgi:hypothetical protein